MRKWWHWLVFIAALGAGVSLILMLAVDLTEGQRTMLEEADILILIIFAADLFNEYRNFRGSGIRFTREHWLDIIAVIPLFRIIRIAEVAKLERLARLGEIGEVRRGMEAEETLSESIHARRLKGKKEEPEE